MGNDFSFGNENQKQSPNEKKKRSKFKLLFTSKQSKASKHNEENIENFMLNFNKTNSNIIPDVSSLDQRRAVFISLNGLFESWRCCPSIILYPSIFILPLKRIWIYEPTKYRQQIKEIWIGQYSQFYKDDQSLKEFLTLLKWKDSKGLVFWMFNDYKEDNKLYKSVTNKLIDPFWVYFSSKLQELYDPMTGKKYKALHFNKSWWQNEYKEHNKHSMSDIDFVKVSAIYNELYLFGKNFKSIKEIMHQSNPNSFNILYSYHQHGENKMIKPANINNIFNIDNCVDDNDQKEDLDINLNINNNGNDNISICDEQEDNCWFISTDYDPNDIKSNHVETDLF